MLLSPVELSLTQKIDKRFLKILIFQKLKKCKFTSKFDHAIYLKKFSTNTKNILRFWNEYEGLFLFLFKVLQWKKGFFNIGVLSGAVLRWIVIMYKQRIKNQSNKCLNITRSTLSLWKHYWKQIGMYIISRFFHNAELQSLKSPKLTMLWKIQVRYNIIRKTYLETGMQ